VRPIGGIRMARRSESDTHYRPRDPSRASCPPRRVDPAGRRQLRGGRRPMSANTSSRTAAQSRGGGILSQGRAGWAGIAAWTAGAAAGSAGRVSVAAWELVAATRSSSTAMSTAQPATWSGRWRTWDSRRRRRRLLVVVARRGSWGPRGLDARRGGCIRSTGRPVMMTVRRAGASADNGGPLDRLTGLADGLAQRVALRRTGRRFAPAIGSPASRPRTGTQRVKQDETLATRPADP